MIYKNILALASAVVLLCGFTANKAAFMIENKGMSNKTAAVDIIMNSSESLRAVAFECSYSRSDLTLTDAVCPKCTNERIVEFKETDSGARLVCLCRTGKAFELGEKLFTLKFASEKDSANVFLEVADCLDSSGNPVKLNDKFTIEFKSGQTAKATVKPKAASPETVSVSVSGTVSGNKAEIGDETVNNDDYLEESDDYDPKPREDFLSAVPLIIGSFSVVIGLLCAVLIIQTVQKKKNAVPKASAKEEAEDEIS